MPVRPFENKVPQLGSAVFIDDSAVVIGDVVLGNDVSVWPMAVIRGDVEKVTVGDGTNIQDGAVLHVSHANRFVSQSYPLAVGKGVTVGHKAVIHACTIGDYCLVGIGSIVMDGAVLEDYTMLGAGALVPPGKRLPGGHLYVGTPARQVRLLNDSEREFLEYSASHYQELKNRHLQIP